MTQLKRVNPEPEIRRVRAQSGTAYPYFNLDTSIKVAAVIHERGGGVCTMDQLASFLGYSGVRNGTFLTRLSAAKLFCLVESQGDRISLTEQAYAIIAPVRPEDAENAKIRAFLAVPLFAQVYEEAKGKTLPPEVGLRNLFEHKYKIVKERIAPAIRVFYESAEQAGFFALNNGERTKLIMPPVGGIATARGPAQAITAPSAPEGKESPTQEKPRGGGGDGPMGIHPAIIGLLRELPAPGKWSGKSRFMKAFQNTLDFIYPDDEDSAS
ncbi:MAG: hypothetical protein PHY92_02250 [Alphaproteobacteria bacterium]|nr:hypothetical protein [Alphaproteobacteria bacterium]